MADRIEEVSGPKGKVDAPKAIDTQPAVAEPTSGQGGSRFVRTLLQGTFVTLLLQAWQAFAPLNWQMNADQQAIVFALVMAILSLIQVIIEDGIGVAILRTPAAKKRA